MNRSPNVMLYELDAARAREFSAAARQRDITVVCRPLPRVTTAGHGALGETEGAHVAVAAAPALDGAASRTTRQGPARSARGEAAEAIAAGRAFIPPPRAPRSAVALGPEIAVIVASDVYVPAEHAAEASANDEGPEAPSPAERRALLRTILDQLFERGTPALIWGLRNPPIEAPGHVDFAGPETPLDEVFGRLVTLARYGPLVVRLEREIVHLDRLGRQLNRYFAEVDQELRLAGRLQRDFLPRETAQISGLRCAALFQPATWVSGDLYDVFRIDEQHVGIFVADAMGHGLAAGIMTMFLRQTLHVKEIDGDSYRVRDPAAAMALLHEGLCRQTLPNQHFVTAVYGTLDMRTFELRIARGGHPYPIVIARGGEIRELRPDGALLGVPDLSTDFQEARATLEPGDKLVLYTDGLEDVLLAPAGAPAEQTQFTPLLHELAALRADGFIDSLRNALDRREGSLHQADDMTIVVLERE